MVAPELLKPAPLANAIAVEMDKVNKWYGNFHVLRDVDLQAARGEYRTL